jgi:uncharacterized protein (DUF2252 family)
MRDVLQEFKAFNKADAQRNPELIRNKIERMSKSAFAFFRGSFHLFARDVIEKDVTPLPVNIEGATELDLVGDIHSENYGTYKADDGLIHYDINDFDETTQGQLAIDVCRFAINILLAAQERQEPLEQQVTAALAGLASYAETMQAGFKKGKFRDLDLSETNPGECDAIRQLIAAKTAVKRAGFIDKETEGKDKRLLKRSDKYFNLADAEKNQALRLIEDLKRRWKDVPLEKHFFDVNDVCGRISGIGSMGRRRFVVLVSGKGFEEKHNILLEFKEARSSAYDIFRKRDTTPEAHLKRAERVIAVARASQAASPKYMGFATDGDLSFQVREISPHADRVDFARDKLKPASFIATIQAQATILARVHLRAIARGVGPANPLPDLAEPERFGQRVLAFALAYADVAHRDWGRFQGAKAEL